MKKRIAILFHENAARYGGGSRMLYVIDRLARYWREAGHSVRAVYGARRFVPADLAIVHVDLSVVTDPYLDLARRYPRALNAQVRDVRKSTFSRNLVAADDPYSGPVIVKSDLNYGGLPERLLAPDRSRAASGIRRLLSSARSIAGQSRPARREDPTDYRIYDSPRDVPRAVAGSGAFVVEKFLPEVEDGLYCVRNYHFFGDREVCHRIAGPHPIVKAGNTIRREIVEPHPEIVALRKALHFDFGKFDYVVHDGTAVLLDINKTPGDARHIDEMVAARVRHTAGGLESYLA